MPHALPDATPERGAAQADVAGSIADPAVRRYFRVLHAYADYLRAHHKPLQAAAALVLCRRYEDAIQVYGEAGDWRAALNLACKLRYDQFEVQALALALSEALRVRS